jgi:hypothetical protein
VVPRTLAPGSLRVEAIEGTARSAPGIVGMHFPNTLSQIVSSQRPPVQRDRASAATQGGVLLPGAGGLSLQMQTGVPAIAPPAMQMSRTNIATTIQQQAAAFSNAYSRLFAQVDRSRGVQEVLLPSNDRTVNAPYGNRLAFNGTSNGILTSNSPLVNSLASMSAACPHNPVAVPSSSAPLAASNIVAAAAPFGSAAISANSSTSHIMVHGERLEATKVAKIFSLRSKATAGSDAMDQSIAGRSAVTANMMRVSPAIVKDIWARKAGVEITKVLWTEQEFLLDSCEKFRAISGIQTSANRRSGPPARAKNVTHGSKGATDKSSTKPSGVKRISNGENDAAPAEKRTRHTRPVTALQGAC